MIRTAAILAVLLASPQLATGAEYYCVVDGTTNWNRGIPETILRADDEHGYNGWLEFWVDTATGEWLGRTTGSRAAISDGGNYDIVSEGTGYRAHWVGIEDHGGFESLRIDLTRDPVPFVRADRDGFVEIGTCVDSTGRSFFERGPLPP